MRNVACESGIFETNIFMVARDKFDRLQKRVASKDALSMSHSEVEEFIEAEGREVLRELLQAHLDLRGRAQPIQEVKGCDGIVRETERVETSRQLTSLLGKVSVTRSRFCAPGRESLHPVDADLNLPREMYSLRVRRRTALASSKMSYDEVVAHIAETTGAHVPKQQTAQLVKRAAVDFERFYQQRTPCVSPDETGSILVQSFDGKGVVMRSEGLRPSTRRAAEEKKKKLTTRLTKGEKLNRKRMATVAAVHTIEPYMRTAEDIINGLRSLRTVSEPSQRPCRPRPEFKRVWASLERSSRQVMDEAIFEAMARDPERKKLWVVLVDGDRNQLRQIKNTAKRHGVDITIVLDFIHVLEYLWKATYVFNPERSTDAEEWVLERLLRILQGKATGVAAGIRRSATRRGLSKDERKLADVCAKYICNHAQYMMYDRYLAKGLPIATGIIEGACRHLVRDRLDITGARWSLEGAEAVLKIRALSSSGDFDEYWNYHEAQERHRNHASKYSEEKIPELKQPEVRWKLRAIKGGKLVS